MVSKAIGYNLKVCYKKGVENKVADALSRVTEPELLALVVSSISIDLLDRIKGSYWNEADYIFEYHIQQVLTGSSSTRFSWVDGVLRRKGKIVVGNNIELRNDILKVFHGSMLHFTGFRHSYIGR